MNREPKEWMERWLGGKTLPLLKKTLTDLEELYRSPDPFEQLAETVQRDPALTSQVFMRANGVQHQRFGMPVTTVEHAAMMLGLDRMKSIPAGLPVIDPESIEDERRGLLRTYSQAWHAGVQSMAWAKLRADMVPWEVFAATLLYKIGKMAVWACQPEKAQEIEDLTHGSGRLSHTAAQRHVLGFSYDALSLEMARAWKLPLLVHDALRPENSGRPRIRVILLALELARAAEHSWYSKATNACIEEAAELLNLGFSEMVTVVHQAAVKSAAAYRSYGVRPAAAGLISVPSLYLESSPDGPGNRPAAVVKPDPAGTSHHSLHVPQPMVLEQTIRWFSDRREKPAPLPEIMKRAVHGMQKGIGLARVVFATCTPDLKGLKARVVCSSEESAEFSQFYLELDPPHLFTRLMEKPMSLWINKENRDKYGELLPSSLMSMLDTDSFFARSLFLKERPLGMFYCDCHRDSGCLDEERYREFQHVCDFVSAAMARR